MSDIDPLNDSPDLGPCILCGEPATVVDEHGDTFCDEHAGDASDDD